MTSIGRLVECIEDIEIVNLKIKFFKKIFYTALIDNEIYVIDRKHKNIKLEKKIFNKHFKII